MHALTPPKPTIPHLTHTLTTSLGIINEYDHCEPSPVKLPNTRSTKPITPSKITPLLSFADCNGPCFDSWNCMQKKTVRKGAPSCLWKSMTMRKNVRACLWKMTMRKNVFLVWDRSDGAQKCSALSGIDMATRKHVLSCLWKTWQLLGRHRQKCETDQNNFTTQTPNQLNPQKNSWNPLGDAHKLTFDSRTCMHTMAPQNHPFLIATSSSLVNNWHNQTNNKHFMSPMWGKNTQLQHSPVEASKSWCSNLTSKKPVLIVTLMKQTHFRIIATFPLQNLTFDQSNR